MGLFGKSEQGIPFKVWKTRAAQLKGIGTEAMMALKTGSDAVVVTFFDDRYLECKSFFEQTGIPFFDVLGGIAEGNVRKIHLINANGLDSFRASALQNPAVLFHGMHPLPGHEARAVQKIPNTKSKWCFASLEDPLFKVFGMENVASLMETLGMDDAECIEHKFVDKAISSAQNKLAAKVKSERQASSEVEWYQKNISR